MKIKEEHLKVVKDYMKTIGLCLVITTVYTAVVVGMAEVDNTDASVTVPMIAEASSLGSDKDSNSTAEIVDTMDKIEQLVPVTIDNNVVELKQSSARLAQMEYEEASVAKAKQTAKAIDNGDMAKETITLAEVEKEAKEVEKEAEKENKAENPQSNDSKSDKGSDSTYEATVIDGLTSDEQESINKCIKLGAKEDDYEGKPISLNKYSRELLERLVFGEAGNQGFTGAVLVAQAVHDEMLMQDCYDTAKIIKLYAFSGDTTKGTSETVKRAVSYVFDKGGYGVKHRLVYFYAPGLCKSAFHESQTFVVEWKGHRFFDQNK